MGNNRDPLQFSVQVNLMLKYGFNMILVQYVQTGRYVLLSRTENVLYTVLTLTANDITACYNTDPFAWCIHTVAHI